MLRCFDHCSTWTFERTFCNNLSNSFQALKSYGVDVIEDAHLVTHGNIGTAAGCLAAVDLIGWAIEKMYDEKVREDVIASVLPVGQGQVCIYP